MPEESEFVYSPTMLAGKVAVVSGAGSLSRGIGNGRAIAIRLAQAGARVLVIDSVLESAEYTARLIEERGGIAAVAVGDVADQADARRLVEDAVERWGRLDALVNNVGIAGPNGTVEHVDIDEWRRCMDVNVTSMVLMSRYAVDAMRSGGGGVIVNVSSVVGLRGMNPAVAYSASKGAVISLSKSMALTHARDKINVNVVAPGLVYTPMVSTQGLDEVARAKRAAASPLGVEGTAWNVADAVTFLAGPSASWITGVVLPVDGGLLSTIDPEQVPAITTGEAV